MRRLFIITVVLVCLCGCGAQPEAPMKAPLATYMSLPTYPTFSPIEVPEFTLSPESSVAPSLAPLGQKVFTVTMTARPLYNNNVGHSWGVYVVYDDVDIEREEEMTVCSVSDLSLTAKVIEYDSVNDVGTTEVVFSLDVEERETRIVDVVVRENRGRYAGNTACWQVTITVERIS